MGRVSRPVILHSILSKSGATLVRVDMVHGSKIKHRSPDHNFLRYKFICLFSLVNHSDDEIAELARTLIKSIPARVDKLEIALDSVIDELQGDIVSGFKMAGLVVPSRDKTRAQYEYKFNDDDPSLNKILFLLKKADYWLYLWEIGYDQNVWVDDLMIVGRIGKKRLKRPFLDFYDEMIRDISDLESVAAL